MRRRTLIAGLLGLACAGASFGQTFQLPSLHTFSVDTTVVVPDSGAGFVAGQKRASSSTKRLGGLPPQRAAGVERQAAGVAVTARVHDPEAADAAVLKEAQARRAQAAAATSKTKSSLALSAGDPGLQSVAELRRQRATGAASNDGETLELIERARRASSAGKSAIAASYYRSASRKAAGALKQKIDAEWRGLSSASKESTDAAATLSNEPAAKQPAKPKPRGVAF